MAVVDLGLADPFTDGLGGGDPEFLRDRPHRGKLSRPRSCAPSTGHRVGVGLGQVDGGAQGDRGKERGGHDADLRHPRSISPRVLAPAFLAGLRLGTQLWLKESGDLTIVGSVEQVLDQVSSRFE
nr:hypothetical protein [Cryptosporangium aurantiacum]